MIKTVRSAVSLLTATFVFSLVLSACGLKRPANNPTAAPTASPEATEATKKQTVYEFTASTSGQLAIDLIEAGAQVETQEYGSAGKFVTSINGLAGDNSNYWAFYLNGNYAEQGVSQTKLAKGDTIKFVYEAVTPTK